VVTVKGAVTTLLKPINHKVKFIKMNMKLWKIEYLNKDKNFQKDTVYFETLEDAKEYGKQKIDNFHIDMIQWNKPSTN
jgi:hypothetical protein